MGGPRLEREKAFIFAMVSSFRPLERELMGPPGRRAAFRWPSGVDEGVMFVWSEVERKEGGWGRWSGAAEGEGLESDTSERSSRSPESGRGGDIGGVFDPVREIFSAVAMFSLFLVNPTAWYIVYRQTGQP